MSLSSETVDTLTEDNNTAAEDRGQGQSNQGQKEEGEEEVQQRFSYEVDPDIGVIVCVMRMTEMLKTQSKHWRSEEHQNKSPKLRQNECPHQKLIHLGRG